MKFGSEFFPTGPEHDGDCGLRTGWNIDRLPANWRIVSEMPQTFYLKSSLVMKVAFKATTPKHRRQGRPGACPRPSLTLRELCLKVLIGWAARISSGSYAKTIHGHNSQAVENMSFLNTTRQAPTTCPNFRCRWKGGDLQGWGDHVAWASAGTGGKRVSCPRPWIKPYGPKMWIGLISKSSRSPTVVGSRWSRIPSTHAPSEGYNNFKQYMIVGVYPFTPFLEKLLWTPMTRGAEENYRNRIPEVFLAVENRQSYRSIKGWVAYQTDFSDRIKCNTLSAYSYGIPMGKISLDICVVLWAPICSVQVNNTCGETDRNERTLRIWWGKSVGHVYNQHPLYSK